ncbi:MAG: deoxyribose-phosphate aldolase [Terrimicrobiaceae bacterium]|jgi:deoxyribose-phosphate aldolase
MTIARSIDHTLLKPDATREEILKLCAEAREFGFFSVCVNSSRVATAAEALSGSGVAVAAVTGFPMGAMSSEAKAFETKLAVAAGASEIDTVIAVGQLKDGNLEYVLADLRGVVAAAGEARVKVIFETCLLSESEKITACRLSVEAGAAFVKTSTGFSSGGATVEDVKLMAAAVAGRCEVKASGGIRDLESAKIMLAAGATRLGTSNGVKIVTGEKATEGY